MAGPSVDGDRLLARIEALAEIGAIDGGGCVGEISTGG
jgi:hypothetical protein